MTYSLFSTWVLTTITHESIIGDGEGSYKVWKHQLTTLFSWLNTTYSLFQDLKYNLKLGKCFERPMILPQVSTEKLFFWSLIYNLPEFWGCNIQLMTFCYPTPPPHYINFHLCSLECVVIQVNVPNEQRMHKRCKQIN